MQLSERFTDALNYAIQLHGTQERKGSGVPYVAHLLGVASLALEYGANEDEAIAALLHDAIEDQGGLATRDEILRRFGPDVSQIVEGCTDAYTSPKPPWQERKQAYLDHLPTASSSVRLVSAADKLYNATAILRDYRRIGEGIWDRFTADKAGTLWYYRSLVEAFRRAHAAPPIGEIVEELDRVVSELERLVRSNSRVNA
ncbi:MAG: bifunctional (p)ppGpp synthetase/guanosine-3',5'-bis(diphosphate) 3'-pyrophosphohydrolase [Oscillatoriales cyanobacterium RM2_1_1]|nr:bifunctional (p)ppGpp synthetase/guanosine-3',5'-bis(diphosphate) 3'-pyrophosphohydrolase [Oscillatoriales cyanobacterium SM2_3_0]NJO44665.1 bifunctional (p)ppGpp synthetase/guanosine-3',5'-bis(diphosphate) 3'-pyrophosphohydrolase [Oscillatoriales cyanobacterium RM2_1_1]